MSVSDFSGLPFFFMVLVSVFWSEHFGVDIRHANASLLLELSEMGGFLSYLAGRFGQSIELCTYKLFT